MLYHLLLVRMIGKLFEVQTRNFANYSQDDYCVDMNSAPWTQVFSQNNVGRVTSL